jgi:transposase
LELRHRKERDGRVKDRMKAVLLRSEGWRVHQIAQALRIHAETVRAHLEDYQKEAKLKPENGGSKAFLTIDQGEKLMAHLDEKLYLKVSDICAYVLQEFGVHYTIPGMTKWLQAHDFSYKQPAPKPAKANVEAQKSFVKAYHKLLRETPLDEPILFGDGVHPTMSTKITKGWIRKGKSRPISTTGNRTRLNVFGALNLEAMQLITASFHRLNSEVMSEIFQKIRDKYPKAPKIHLILDQGPYNKALKTQEAAKEWGIVLHYLPPYSPNLNPIERVWKVMNEQVCNHVFFTSAKDFREAILTFLRVTWRKLAPDLTDRINDNFQLFKPVPSG